MGCCVRAEDTKMRRILVNYQLRLWAVITTGMLQGIFAVPMKFVFRWNYENIWLVYSLLGKGSVSVAP
jgi:hypothetical protein